MLVYKSEQDVIDHIRQRAQEQIDKCTKEIQRINNPRSPLQRIQIAQRAAYADILWMVTDYTLRDKQDTAE